MSNQDIDFENAKSHMETLSRDYSEESTVNEARARSGFDALLVYATKVYGTDKEPVEQGIRDLLGDLRHLANTFDMDFDDLNKRADGTFNEEIESPLG